VSVSRIRLLVPAALVAVGACATRSDIQVLQSDLRVMRIEANQADSARRVQLDAVIAALGGTQDSLRSMHAQLFKFQGDVRGELYALGQQLIQVQELTGQSQRRLQELRASMEHRAPDLTAPGTQPSPAPISAPAPTVQPSQTQGAGAGTQTRPSSTTVVVPTPAATPQGASAGSATPGPNQLFQLSLDQLRRGSAAAARAGFQDLVRQYPTADVAPEAQFYIAQSYESEGNIASADSAYALVVSKYPQSARAPSALYKRALALQAQGKVQAARAALDLVIRNYPRSDEAVLARDRLRTLK
jgi:tol-pal system protein YbgF